MSFNKAEYAKEWAKTTGGRNSLRRAKWKFRGINITVKEYAAKLKQQKGLCAICNRPPKTRTLAVDHNHVTKQVRGLLCWNCNKLKVDGHTVESARKVLDYLEYWRDVHENG